MKFICFIVYLLLKCYIINCKTYKFHRYLKWDFQGQNFRIVANYTLPTRTKSILTFTTFCQYLSYLYYFPPLCVNICWLIRSTWLDLLTLYCVKTFFCIMEKVPYYGTFFLFSLRNITSIFHWFWTCSLIVPCAVSYLSYSLAHSTI